SGGRQFDEQNPNRFGSEVDRARGDDVAAQVCEPSAQAVALTHWDLARQIDAIAGACPRQHGDEQLSVLPLSMPLQRCFTAYRAGPATQPGQNHDRTRARAHAVVQRWGAATGGLALVPRAWLDHRSTG